MHMNITLQHTCLWILMAQAQEFKHPTLQNAQTHGLPNHMYVNAYENG